MKTRSFSALAAAIVAAAAMPAVAQNNNGVVLEAGGIEVVTASSAPEIAAIFEEAFPVAQNATYDKLNPKFALATKNRKFMMTVSGGIPVVMGYDIGNDLYNAEGSGINFVTGNIPVPPVPGKKSDYYINAYNASMSFAFVGFAGTKNEIRALFKLGTNGNDPHVKVKKAWLSTRGFTVGQLHTLMADNLALQPPTIDNEGPCGDVVTTNIQVRYESPSFNGFRVAASLEMPTFYSSNGMYRGHDYAQYIGKYVSSDANELVPDIPVWIEYQKSDANRIRFTGILRNFRYRDLVEQKSRTICGWGAMVSGNFSFYKPLTFNFQAVYGKGIGNYIQDISGREISFTPKDNKPGEVTPTPMMGLVFGASYNATSKLQFNAVGSYARVWKVGDYATIGDDGLIASANNYRHATYLAVNCFYSITPYLNWGIEYLYGQRATWELGKAHDNRIQTQIQLSF